MAISRLDPTALREYIETGRSQADAAAHFGVSEAAISQRVKQFLMNTSKVVALERGGQMVDQQMSAAQRLQHIQRVMLEQLTLAEEHAQQPGAHQGAHADRLIRLSAEIRSQIRLELDISRALYDLQVVKDFQRTVFDVLVKESPNTARRILDKLKAQRALRGSVDLSTLDTSGGADAARPIG